MKTGKNPECPSLGTIFDRTMRSLMGLPDVVKGKETTIRHMTPVAELAQTFIVQTFRQKDVGDFLFIEYLDPEQSFRVVLPPSVADAIARQRDALTSKNRKRAAKAEAARRKAQGIEPGFRKGKGA
jgi:hypothetical protein